MLRREFDVYEASQQPHFPFARQLAITLGGIPFFDASRTFPFLYPVTFMFFFSRAGK